MESFENKKIGITGGGSGIGKAIIGEFYKNGGKDFSVMGRHLEKLEKLQADFPGARFHLLEGDVSNPDDIYRFVRLMEDAWGEVDILVNNAGVVSAGPLQGISDADILAQVNINVSGPILLTKHALPLLKKSREAALVNVASGLALIGMPFYATYAASKAAISHFSEVMRRELKDYPIQVLTVYPTATDTPMMESANVASMDSPELVAQKTLDGLKKNDIQVILGGEQQLDNVRSNHEDPLGFDKKVAANFLAMVERTAKHRAM